MKISIEDSNGTTKYTIDGVVYDRKEDIPEAHRAMVEKIEKSRKSNDIHTMLDAIDDGPSDFKSVIGSLFSAVGNELQKPKNAVEEPAAPSTPRGYDRGESTSILPTLIKIFAGIFIGLLIAFVYSKYSKEDAETIEEQTAKETTIPVTDAPAEQTTESTQEEPTVTAIPPNSSDAYLLVDDPNEPPYRMFVGIYKNEKLLLRIDLPDGAMEETGNNRTVRINQTVDEETTLVSKSVTFELKSFGCEVEESDMSWETVRIGDNLFSKAEYGGSGAGNSYQRYYYSYPFEDGCILTMVDYHLRNSDIDQSGAPDFNVVEDIEKVEQLLSTLKTIEN